jgi:hypothetical protein
MDMLEDDDTPSSSMPWHHPDYGPIHKHSKDKFVAEAFDEHNSSLPFLKSTGPSFLASHSMSDEDVYLSYDHSTDSDDDGGLVPCLVERDFNRQRLWNEVYIEDGHYAGSSSMENDTNHWILISEALNKSSTSGEGSNTEDSYTFKNEPISRRNLALGAAGLSTLINKDRKRKWKRKVYEEHEDTGETLTQPNTRLISQRKLINEVKKIYADLLMVEANYFGFETWDAYFESKYPRINTDVASPHESVSAVEDTWVESVGECGESISMTEDEKIRNQTWTEITFRWYKPSGELPIEGRPYDHCVKWSRSNVLQRPSYLYETLDAAIPTFRASPEYNEEVRHLQSYVKQNTDLEQDFSNVPAKIVGHDPWEGSSKNNFSKKTLGLGGQGFLSSETSSTRSPQPQATPPPRKPKFSSTKHICPTCKSSFAQAYELRKHTKYHSKPITCPLAGCTHRFGRQRDLIRHQKAAHKNTHHPEEWFCSFEACRYNIVPFGRRDNLLRHVRNMHAADESIQR